MEVAFLFDFVAPLAILVGPPVALARWLGAADAAALQNLFAIPLDPPRPRGVQEEEPVRWRLERLQPRRDASANPPAQSLRRAIPSFDARQGGC